MSTKQIITLAVIAGVLVIAGLIKKYGGTEASLADEYELTQLVPEDFLVSDVGRLDIYRGSKKDEKVSLVCEDAKWSVESKYGAPGKQDKVEEFLGKIKDLAGEYRSDSAEVLGDYNLSDEKALHVEVFKAGEEAPWVHLLVGKKAGQNRSFVRQDGQTAVHTVNENLASDAGIWGDDDKAPDSTEWLDKTAIDLEKDEIDRISLVTPDRKLVFERREVEKEVAGEEGAEEKGAEEKGEADEQKPKEKKWFLVEGGPPDGLKSGSDDFKQAGIDGMLSALDSFSISDVEDPAKKAELGLNKPAFQCVVRTGGEKETSIVASLEKVGGDAYMMIDDKNVIYKVSNWRFDDLWAKGDSLFQLKGLDGDKEKVKSITYKRGQDTLNFVRQGEKNWMMKPGAPGMKLKTDKIGDIAGAVAKVKPSDFVDAANVAGCGFDSPLAVVSFVTEDKKTHTVTVGGEAKSLEGRYVSLDGGKTVSVLAKSDVQKAVPEAKDLFELKVADIKADDVVEVVVSGSSEFTAEREAGKPWNLSASGTKIAPSESAINSLLGKFSPLNADDLTLGRQADFAAADTISIKTKNGGEIAFEFASESDGKRVARIGGIGVDVVFEASSAKRLIPTVKQLADRALVTLKQNEIVKVAVERAEDSFQIAKDGDAWKLTVAGAVKECKSAAAEDYVRKLTASRAMEVELGHGVSGEDLTTIVITGKDGVESKLSLGKEKDGKVAVQKGAEAIAYVISKRTAEFCLPASSTLVVAPAQDAEAAKE